MKTHCKALATALAGAVLLSFPASAKTFDWPIDAPTAGARQFTAYHGETVRFNLQFKGAMTNLAPVCIYYQTNGMGKAEWFTAPGTVFHPTNDCGAAAYRFFVLCTDPDGRDYTANGSLRMLDSPGFEPSSVQLPAQTLDFAKIAVLNPPWPASSGVDAATVTNIVDAATNGLASLVSAASTASTNHTDTATNELVRALQDGEILTYAADAIIAESSMALGENVEGIGIRYATDIFSQLDAATTTNAQQTSALADIAATVGMNTADIATIGSQVNAVGSYLNAEDAKFVSEHYDSSTRMPEAHVEVRLEDHGTNAWITIWNEMTRWGAFVGDAFDWNAWNGLHAWMTNITAELSFKADRAWGAYDSETGGYSPEGYTQISSSNILIAAGMAYQRTVTTAGSVWILQCNTGVAHLGGDTNGFFRVMDSEGNVHFEIIKGDRRELGCDASGITVGANNVMTIPYSVDADAHPTIQCTASLNSPSWKSEDDPDCLCTVSWSGVSGAYVATVTPKTAQASMFVRATYLAGAETRIRNTAPMSVEGGILCTDGIHKCRAVYNSGTITWEVVP